MKNATLKKIFASTFAVALCVPMLLADPMAISANAAAQTISGNTPGTDNPDTDKPDTDNPDTDKPGTDTPDTDKPGTDKPGGDSSVSGNVPSTSESSSSGTSSSSSNTNAASTAVSQTISANRQVTVGGRSMSSSVSGIYIATAIRGIAVATPSASVSAAAGLSQADIDAGTNVRFYVCNSSNKEAKAALTSAAAATGKSVAAYVNFDLYTISKKGVVTAVKNASTPIELTIGLPKNVANAGKNVSIICIDKDGKAVVMDDIDTDPNTITINASVFGVYAIVY